MTTITVLDINPINVERGNWVRSTTTRGKNVGVVGIVRWIGSGFDGLRLGVAVEGEDKLRYLSAGRVEVIRPLTAPAYPIGTRVRVAYRDTFRSGEIVANSDTGYNRDVYDVRMDYNGSVWQEVYPSRISPEVPTALAALTAAVQIGFTA